MGVQADLGKDRRRTGHIVRAGLLCGLGWNGEVLKETGARAGWRRLMLRENEASTVYCGRGQFWPQRY